MSSTLYFKSVDASFCDCRGFWGNIARRRVRRAIFPKLRGNNFQWWPITPVSICFVIPRRNTKQIHRLFVHNTANNSMTSRTHGLKTSTFSITSFSCTYMPQLISMQLPVFSRPYCTQHLSVCLSVCPSVRPSVCDAVHCGLTIHATTKVSEQVNWIGTTWFHNFQPSTSTLPSNSHLLHRRRWCHLAYKLKHT